ncbi:MAG: hypothetical protein ACXWCP_20190 [Burkholderiales bacterium]
MAMTSHFADHGPSGARGNRFYALILASLCVLFVLRVAGQAVQRWAPLSFLPPFEAFQGSHLPYWMLLSIQLVLLILMLGVTSRVNGGALQKSARAGQLLRWIGSLYMAGSVGRIAVGLFIDQAPAWFTAWIPGFFHLVLAGFVLTLSAYHTTERGITQEDTR